jgi:hypothetical protein
LHDEAARGGLVVFSFSLRRYAVAKWIVPPIVVPLGFAVLILVVFFYRHLVGVQFLLN